MEGAFLRGSVGKRRVLRKGLLFRKYFLGDFFFRFHASGRIVIAEDTFDSAVLRKKMTNFSQDQQITERQTFLQNNAQNCFTIVFTPA